VPGIKESVENLLEDAIRSCSLIYGIREALEWGRDFHWPDEVLIRDRRLAETVQYDLEKMVQQHHKQREKYRLSVERITKLVPVTDPDY